MVHISSTLKGLYAAACIFAAAWLVVDPTTRTTIIAATIVSLPPTITGVFNLYIQVKLHQTLGKVETNTNSTLSALTKERNEAVSSADIGKGFKAGEQSERDRQKE